jgi:hypothetical protein
MHEHVSGYVGHELAPMSRRALSWTFDAALGLGLAACFASVVGAGNDLRTLWHLLAFKSLTGKAGRQLSAAMHPGQLSALRPILGLLAISCAIAAASVAYRVITTALWGAGLGKALFGLQIVVDQPSDARPCVPGWARSWKRWVLPQVSGLIPLPATGLLAYLPAFRDSRRRGLHDRAAGTVVIDTRAPLRTAPIAEWNDRVSVSFYG